MQTLSPTVRPVGLASAAACALAGGDPLMVSNIPASHPALAVAVRELADLLGEPVPPAFRDDSFDLSREDAREAFPESSHEAEDHYRWAMENGIA